MIKGLFLKTSFITSVFWLITACGGTEETFTVTTETDPETGVVDVTVQPDAPGASPISVVVDAPLISPTPSLEPSSEPEPAANLVQAIRFKSFYDKEGIENRYLQATDKVDNAAVYSVELQPAWYSMQWVLESHGEGTVRIRNRWSGRYLTDSAGTPWSTPKLTSFAQTDTQLWYKEDKRDATIAFRNKASELYLNVESGESDSQTTMVYFNDSWDGLLWIEEFVADIDPYSLPNPTSTPDAEPTLVPTTAPTSVPTQVPSLEPTSEPTAEPTVAPTAEPTSAPTPSSEPSPTMVPTPTSVPEPVAEGDVELWRLENVWTEYYLSVNSQFKSGLVNSIPLNEDWEQMQWVFEPIANSNAVMIRNRWTGFTLTDLYGANTSAVENAYPDESSTKQQWIVSDERDDGTVAIQNVASGRFIHPRDDQEGTSMMMVDFNLDYDGIFWKLNSAGAVDREDLTTAVRPISDDNGIEGAKAQTSTHNYGHALQLTPLYFAANQLGELTDTRLNWRQDSQTDGQYSGGYVDAGDNILFGKAQFAAISSMCITAIFFEDELKELGQYDDIQRQIKHGTDFILRGHETESNGETKSLVVQLGSSPVDHPYWISIEDSTHNRPIYRMDKNNRGSDYVGLAAAATGLCSAVFNGGYSDDLKSASSSLFSFAKKYRGLGHENGNIVTVYKNANGDEDELAYGALGQYIATGNAAFIEEANQLLDDTYLPMWQTDYEHSEQIVSTLIALWGNNTQRESYLINYFNNWKNVGTELKKTEGGYIIHDSNNWGSSGSILPTLFNMSIYSKTRGTTEWDDHIKSQIDYLLGTNPANNSYICGFGTDQNCSKIHHRGASGSNGYPDSNYKNKYMLWGAVLGGVTENDWDFENSHTNWKGNEPTVAYNSKVQSPLVYLYSKFGGKPMTDEALQSKLDNWSGYQ